MASPLSPAAFAPSALLSLLSSPSSFSSLFSLCELLDLSLAAFPDEFSLSAYGFSMDFLTALTILSAALDENFVSAKFCWKRASAGVKKSSGLVERVWRTVELLKNKKFQLFFNEAKNLLGEVEDLAGQKQAIIIKAAVEALISSTRRRVDLAIALAYAKLPSATAAELTGRSVGEAEEEARKAGWEVDEGKHFLQPCLKRSEDSKANEETGDFPQLAQLSRLVENLESR